MSNFEIILKELSNYKHDRSELIEMCVQERLSKSLHNYYKSISESYNYLINKDNLKVAKELNKEL